MPIGDVRVGNRHRRDLGDLAALAASIGEIGLLHPIVIRPDGMLIAGERRLRAAELLGWKEIPVKIVDLDSVVRGEYAENFHRKDFTYAEAVAIMRGIKPLEEAAARERQAATRNKGEGRPGKLPTREIGRAADKAARATGKKRRTLEKAEQVVAVAEQNPERFADLAARLNEDDVKVDAVYREMKQRRQRATYEERADNGADVGDLETMARTGRRFAVINADPPWEFKVPSPEGKQRSADRHHDTLSLDAIKALPVANLAMDDCALFLWGAWPKLPGALDVIKAWGFEYKTAAFVWVKRNRNGDGLFTGVDYWTRANSEFCLLATKGSPFRIAQNVDQIIEAPVGDHSEKPEAVRARIEQLLVGPYLELFARRPVPGWTVWVYDGLSIPLYVRRVAP